MEGEIGEKSATEEQENSHSRDTLGWILALIHAEKTGNFYWLPLLKKLPASMAEGFQEVKEFLAEKGLTHCPPIARSDLED